MDHNKIQFVKWEHPCGWYRVRNADLLHAEEVIRHPVYGKVTSRRAALLDIARHNCDTYLEAIVRLREKREDATTTQTVHADSRKPHSKARASDDR